MAKRPSASLSVQGHGFPDARRDQVYGVIYEVDLVACRELLASRALALMGENPDAGSGMDLVADAAGVSRRALNRFFSGDPVEVATFAGVITRGLKVDVDRVARRIERQPA